MPRTVMIFFLSFLFSVALVFCADSLHATDKEPLVIQDMSVLKTSDGKIVDQRIVDLEPGFSDKVECHKIKYLSDELKVVGFLLFPKIRDEKLPVLIYNRGGNREHGAIFGRNLSYLAYLASNNYVVLASQYRGNDGGEGKESFGGSDINDVLNLIVLAKSLEYADPNKIVMLGYSRGGMMTYLAIKSGAQIRAAAVVGGLTDIVQIYREREDMRRVIEDLVGNREQDWRDRSAYYFPEKINVPVLILHGEDDLQVNVTQAKKFSEKLFEFGKECEIQIFPKGDHGLNTHRSERNTKILKFFAKHMH